METIAFNKSQLHDFINSEQFRALKNIPISKERALSQINNPRADKEDILLVAQFDGDITTGYLGILPDYIVIADQKEKIGWLTCFWVHDEYKSKDVAANLFRRVLRAWNHKVFITNIVPWLEPVYQKTKIFKPTQFKSGYRGYLRFNLAEILPPKSPFFQKIETALKIGDSLLNLFFDLRFVFQKSNAIKYNYTLVSHINDQLAQFINSNNVFYWNRRSQEEINWILQYPWLIETSSQTEDSSRYYFSLISKRFRNQLYNFSNESGKIVGLVFITIRDNHLAVPYIFADKDSIDEISKFLFNKMSEYKLNTLTIFNDELIASFKKLKLGFLFSKTIKKPYFISKKIDLLENLNFQDGDGDCAFY